LFHEDEVVGAISISVPTVRASGQRLRELVRVVQQGAARISRALSTSTSRQVAVAI
jgi:DNA-binding IclR family transcriptional regulator